MSRGMDAANETAIEQTNIAPIIFADLDFSSGHVRVHSGIGTVTWGGYDWAGLGAFGSVSGLEEKAELGRKTVTYTLSGVPNDLVGTVKSEYYQGRPDKVYLGFFDTTTYQLTADPELLHSGLMDTARTKVGSECVVTITSESRMAAWGRPVVRRYTDAEQQARFTGDKGLEFISQAAQKEIVWGRKT